MMQLEYVEKSYHLQSEVPRVLSFKGINYEAYDLLFHRILINRCCVRSRGKIEFHIGTARELQLPPRPLKSFLGF